MSDPQKKIRVLIADDHVVVREGLRTLIEYQRDMTIVGEAGNGVEAVCLTRTTEPDVILLDLVMPHMGGLEAISEIKIVDPEARILVLTSFAEDDRILAAIRAGALGYLLKDSSGRDLLQAIRDVSQGTSSLHPTVARKLVRELQHPAAASPLEEPLTAREVEVLQLLAQGLSNPEIAQEMTISSRTVRNYISTILNKLHLTNRVQATLYALRQGITSLSEDASSFD